MEEGGRPEMYQVSRDEGGSWIPGMEAVEELGGSGFE